MTKRKYGETKPAAMEFQDMKFRKLSYAISTASDPSQQRPVRFWQDALEALDRREAGVVLGALKADNIRDVRDQFKTFDKNRQCIEGKIKLQPGHELNSTGGKRFTTLHTAFGDAKCPKTVCSVPYWREALQQLDIAHKWGVPGRDRENFKDFVHAKLKKAQARPSPSPAPSKMVTRSCSTLKDKKQSNDSNGCDDVADSESHDEDSGTSLKKESHSDSESDAEDSGRSSNEESDFGSESEAEDSGASLKNESDSDSESEAEDNGASLKNESKAKKIISKESKSSSTENPEEEDGLVKREETSDHGSSNGSNDVDVAVLTTIPQDIGTPQGDNRMIYLAQLLTANQENPGSVAYWHFALAALEREIKRSERPSDSVGRKTRKHGPEIRIRFQHQLDKALAERARSQSRSMYRGSTVDVAGSSQPRTGSSAPEDRSAGLVSNEVPVLHHTNGDGKEQQHDNLFAGPMDIDSQLEPLSSSTGAQATPMKNSKHDMLRHLCTARRKRLGPLRSDIDEQSDHYILQVKLAQTQDPEISRIIVIGRKASFADLHKALQIAFHRSDPISHEFAVTHGSGETSMYFFIFDEKLFSNRERHGFDNGDSIWRDRFEQCALESVVENPLLPADIQVTYLHGGLEHDMRNTWVHNIVFLGHTGARHKGSGLGDSAQRVMCMGGEGTSIPEDCDGPGLTKRQKPLGRSRCISFRWRKHQ